MKRLANELYQFESGEKINFMFNIVGLDNENLVAVCLESMDFEDITHLKPRQEIELANFMIRRWCDYKKRAIENGRSTSEKSD